MNRGKRYLQAAEKVDQSTPLEPEAALALVKELAGVKFDETVDIAVRLGVDPKHGDQMVRGIANLPHGTGKKKRVAVFATGEAAKEAEEAGAIEVGAEDLVEKIQKGWRDFDVLVASPDMMPKVGKLGRILGPRMPNPKAGTVTKDVGKVVRDIASSSRVEFRVEKAGIVHLPIGKTSFGVDQLTENFKAFIQTLIRARPTAAKGRYIRSITVSSSMGPGVRIDPTEATVVAK